MMSAAVSCYLVPLRLKYLPQLSTLKHPQSKPFFYYQLMHTTLKNAELLKHSKLDKNAFLSNFNLI